MLNLCSTRNQTGFLWMLGRDLPTDHLLPQPLCWSMFLPGLVSSQSFLFYYKGTWNLVIGPSLFCWNDQLIFFLDSMSWHGLAQLEGLDLIKAVRKWRTDKHIDPQNSWDWVAWALGCCTLSTWDAQHAFYVELSREKGLLHMAAQEVGPANLSISKLWKGATFWLCKHQVGRKLLWTFSELIVSIHTWIPRKALPTLSLIQGRL